jgi:hypothetical protein
MTPWRIDDGDGVLCEPGADGVGIEPNGLANLKVGDLPELDHLVDAVNALFEEMCHLLDVPEILGW